MKEIPNFEGVYVINEIGEVHSLPRVVKGKDGVMYPFKGKKIASSVNKQNGYIQIDLWKNTKSHKYYIHRLLAKIFIPNPSNKPEVNHINSNRLDNSLNNLEWVTSKENSIHAYNSGFASQKKRRKLIEQDYNEILDRFLLGESFVAILKDFNISSGRLSINLRNLVRKWGKESLYEAEKLRQQQIRARENG